MSELTPRARERALFLYRNALERGDFDTVSRILRLAERDSLLEGMIFEMAEIDEADSGAPPSIRNSRGIGIIVTIRRRLSPDGWPPKPNSDEETNSMNIVLEPQKIINRQARYYLTIAAAIAVFILLGGIVFNMIPRLPFRPLNPPRAPSLAVITPENVDQIQQIGFLGRGNITGMAWSPDGSVLALGSLPSGIIWLYNPGDLNAEPRWLTGNPGGVTQLAFSADGKTLVSIGSDKMIRVWDMETTTQRAQYQNRNLDCVALSSDGTLAAVGIGRNVSIINTATGEEIATLEGHEKKVNAVAFSPDAKLIVSAGLDETVRVWDAASGAQLAQLEGHDGAVESIAFNPDGSMFASGGRDGTVRLWDWNGAAGTIGLARRGHEKAVERLTFSPDGSMLASASLDNTIRLWNMDSRSQQAILTGHTDRIRGITFSPDGKTLASVSQDQTLRMWDVESGTQVNSVALAMGNALSGATIVFTPDSRTLISPDETGVIYLWDVPTRAVRMTLQGHTDVVYVIAISPDGSLLASSSQDFTVRLWDLRTGQQRAILDRISGGSFAVAFSPDGKTVASAGYRSTVRLWDVATRDESTILEGPRNDVFSLFFSPDGKSLASAGINNTVTVWDVATGKIRLTLTPGVTLLGFSPDGMLIGGSSGSGDIFLWDAATGEERFVLQGHQNLVPAAAFSPDGRLLASGSGEIVPGRPNDDMTIRLWELATGQELRVISAHNKTVAGLVFSPDGRILASASGDRTLRLWGVPNGD
jgi:WD40 repeat protein